MYVFKFRRGAESTRRSRLCPRPDFRPYRWRAWLRLSRTRWVCTMYPRCRLFPRGCVNEGRRPSTGYDITSLKRLTYCAAPLTNFWENNDHFAPQGRRNKPVNSRLCRNDELFRLFFASCILTMFKKPGGSRRRYVIFNSDRGRFFLVLRMLSLVVTSPTKCKFRVVLS